MDSPFTPQPILDFWFADDHQPYWFTRDRGFDTQVRDRFGELYLAAREGKLENWQHAPRSALALILALDQFPRNMFRNSPQAFATDAQALAVARHAVELGYDQQLPPAHLQFLYMPFMHSEALADQERGVQLYSTLDNAEAYDYMVQHRDIIARFGRFPHRNAVLGRESTAEEAFFLTQPGSSF